MENQCCNQERKTDILRLCSVISFSMLVLYFLDIILLGTGNLTKFGSLSTRILFFGLALLFSIPVLLKNFQALLRQKFVICIILFMACVGIGMLRGILKDHPTNIIKSDVLGYLNFLLLPTMLCVVDTKKRKKILMAAIVGACAVMACAAILLSYVQFMPNFEKIYEWLQGSGICALTIMGENASRIVLHTASRLFFVAFAFVLIGLYHTEEKKKIVMGILLMMLFIVGIYLSYTRAFLAGWALAAVVACFILLIRRDKKVIRLLCFILIALLCAAILIGILGATQKANLFKTGLYRLEIIFESSENIELEEDNSLSSDDNMASDPNNSPIHDSEIAGINVRKIKIDLLMKSIKQNPIFGNGLGAAIDYDDGYVEYVYLDIINKMGIVGLVLFLLPFGIMSYCLFFKKKRLDGQEISFFEIAAYTVIVYFLFITYFNPCMNTTLGISHYLLCLTILTGEISSPTPPIQNLEATGEEA